MEILDSVFLRKVLGENPLEKILDADFPIKEIRKKSRFAIIEPNFSIDTAEMGYLFNEYVLKLLPINIDNIKKSNNKKARDYVISAINEVNLDILPPSIEIGASTACTRHCKSCIQGYQDIGQQVMSEEVWGETINQVEQIFNNAEENKPVIHLHWYNEPLKDPKIMQKLIDFKEHNIDYVVMISNGDLLNDKNITSVSDEVFMLIISAKSQRIYDKFQHHNFDGTNIACVDHSIYHDGVEGFNRGGAVFDYHTSKPVKCTKGFNIQIDFDGEIYLCCNDMAKTYSAGNILKDKIFDVWNSKKIRGMREELRQGKFIGKPCDVCTHNYK